MSDAQQPRPLQASDPNFETRVRASFARQGAMKLIGATLGQVAPGVVTIELPFRPDLTQQHGFFHAGMTSAIADSAGGYAGYTLFGPNDSVLTVEFKINLLAPAQGDKLIATGCVVKAGKTLTVCELRVVAVRDGRETLCALGQQTLICMKDRPDSGTGSA